MALSCGMFRKVPRSSTAKPRSISRLPPFSRRARAFRQPPATPARIPPLMATDLRLPTNRIVMPDKDHPLDENNPFEGMMSRFDRAAQLLDLEPGLYKVLRHPEKQIIVSVPVMMDNGEVEV